MFKAIFDTNTLLPDASHPCCLLVSQICIVFIMSDQFNQYSTLKNIYHTTNNVPSQYGIFCTKTRVSKSVQGPEVPVHHRRQTSNYFPRGVFTPLDAHALV